MCSDAAARQRNGKTATAPTFHAMQLVMFEVALSPEQLVLYYHTYTCNN